MVRDRIYLNSPVRVVKLCTVLCYVCGFFSCWVLFLCVCVLLVFVFALYSRETKLRSQ